MHFKRAEPGATVGSIFPAFDCKWCGVVLRVSPGAEVLVLATPALVPG
jgi:hypothetical protein